MTVWPLVLCVSWGGKLACLCRLLAFNIVTDCSVRKESIRKESIQNICRERERETDMKESRTQDLFGHLI